MSSGFPVDTDKFNNYLTGTCCILKSILGAISLQYKVLISGALIIKTAVLPIGRSEDIIESRNKNTLREKLDYLHS